MSEKLLEELAQLNQNLEKGIQRTVSRHPEYPETSLREQVQPFAKAIESATAELSAQLAAREKAKSRRKPPKPKIDNSPPPPLLPEGPESIEAFLTLFDPSPKKVEASIDRLLARKAPSSPKVQAPVFADWAHESIVGQVSSAVTDSMVVPGPAPSAPVQPSNWDSWLMQTGAAPPVHSSDAAPVPPPPNPGTPGFWSWANESAGLDADSQPHTETDADKQKRLQEWLERRKRDDKKSS